MVNNLKITEKYMEELINVRRDLHQIPETGFQEYETSRYICDYLQKEGIKYKSGIAKTGVMGIIEGSKPGKTLLIRADMDALPIQEETKLPFASIHEGKMHACGHDGHMAMVLITGSILNKVRNNLKGTVKLIFQPAEEEPGGAKPMIDEGVMENPEVDYSIGCHIWPAISEGKVGIKSGELMAATGKFNIEIIGKGGHGAMPHLCIDALEVGSQVVGALQRLVSRKIDPLEPAVVTIGSFHSGSAFNIIAERAEISGTTRTFNREIWDSWGEKINKVVNGICKSMDAEFKIDYWKGYPPTVNDDFMTEVVRKCASRVVGEKNIVEPEKSMGGEDMAYFLERSKGCYYFLGAGGENTLSLHNPKFNFNEQILATGVRIYLEVVSELLM